jgi:peptide/bleomycin uptake transporter
MFACFFPRPRLFLISAILWIAFTVALWHTGADSWGALIGLPPAPAGQTESISAAAIWSKPSLWFYAYYWAVAGLFWLAWQIYSPHRWANWSILGSAFIGFATHINATLVVMGNRWTQPFYNMVQASLEHRSHATLSDYYQQFGVLVEIWMSALAFIVLVNFFASHFIFRWRTALNDHYTSHWMRVRAIEGAAQRIQDDTMRFASVVETIGINITAYVMILIAFLPVLADLSTKVAPLPLLGSLHYGLALAAIAWGVSATAVLLFAGYKLPGLQMRNQRVEAAYRKELVYGEDHAARAQPPTLAMLFADVRKNYFALYRAQLFFNIPRYCFLYLDSIFVLFLLIPTILAGTITFGLFIQIIGAFEAVRRAFEYPASIWPQIVDLIAVYGRLRTFEGAIQGAMPAGRSPLPEDANPVLAI